MKGKITIVLLGLALVFGMIAASCDNGGNPTLDPKDVTTEFAYDATNAGYVAGTEGVPCIPATPGVPKVDGTPATKGTFTTGDNETPRDVGKSPAYGSIGENVKGADGKVIAVKARPIAGDDLFKLLQIKVKNPDGTATFVPQYVLGRVSALAGNEIRMKYAGMPIIKTNPVLLSYGQSVKPILYVIEEVKGDPNDADLITDYKVTDKIDFAKL